MDRQTDGRTDRQDAQCSLQDGRIITRGRVRAGPSLQLGTLARPRGAQLTAGYTVNTYSKPPLYYTLGAVAPLLPCLHTHTLGPGGPLRRQTDRHATDTTYQPANRTAAVLPVPSCKLGTATNQSCTADFSCRESSFSFQFQVALSVAWTEACLAPLTKWI